ncbi:MAG: hypothetical protein HYX73_07725 [Acidobacteria bacterium]|nr:hypothetical protein [Acidobacteriota bacterium]
MPAIRSAGPWSRKQAGMTLFMVAALLFVLLGMAALSIDLVALYVNRSEAQRAADAAALAGAKKFLQYVNGASPQFVVEAAARQEAQVVGAQNVVGGQAAQIADGDVVFDFSVPNNPRITVTVQRTAAAGNPVPTFFGKAIGIDEVDISAIATAEAYKPGVGDPPVCVGCIKPWIMPNCDPAHDTPGPSPNPFCPDDADPYVNSDGSIAHSGLAPAGVIGQIITLKYGNPQEAPAPSQFYPIQIPPGTTPEICPECASQAGGSEGPGAALYRHNIACCNTNHFVCGQEVPLELETGNMVGPTGQGTRCLIHQGPGNSGGQDTLAFDANGFHVEMGANNPLVQLGIKSVGAHTDTSSSFITIPLYDGHVLCPGGSCGTTVQIVGFLEGFILGVTQPQNTIEVYVTGISGCGSGGTSANCDDSDTSDTVGTGGQLVPVRLIRN